MTSHPGSRHSRLGMSFSNDRRENSAYRGNEDNGAMVPNGCDKAKGGGHSASPFRIFMPRNVRGTMGVTSQRRE